MGLYLTIFDNDEELEGVEVGSYADFGFFRNKIVMLLENGTAGSKYPTLILHEDSDGQWSPSESEKLEQELKEIAENLKKLSPVELNSDWQRQVAWKFGIRIESLYDCFFDLDGEPLIERLISLTQLSQARKLPILFQ